MTPKNDPKSEASLPADPARGLYQILTPDGRLSAPLPDISPEEMRRLFFGMLKIRIFDERMMTLQRQGRISFYGAVTGQEGAVVGSVLALAEEDWIVPALREGGAILLRGYPLSRYVNQLFGNAGDITKGRQMPCHPDGRSVRYVTMSSCVGSQIPHAVGMAWAAKLKGDPVVVIGYMGDGATSEGDFHVAMNFAGVFQVPVILFCQNNQFAISVSVSRQTASETIAVKGEAYGIPGYRVDGNDVLAVYALTRDLRARVLSGGGPVFVEALTYRIGAHSSSDDPSRYRDETITEAWKQKDPILRLRRFLRTAGILSEGEEREMTEAFDREIRKAVEEAETLPPPPPATLFTDVFHDLPPHLAEQQAEHLALRGEEDA